MIVRILHVGCKFFVEHKNGPHAKKTRAQPPLPSPPFGRTARIGRRLLIKALTRSEAKQWLASRPSPICICYSSSSTPSSPSPPPPQPPPSQGERDRRCPSPLPVLLPRFALLGLDRNLFRLCPSFGPPASSKGLARLDLAA